jgi:hypothetical protein
MLKAWFLWFPHGDPLSIAFLVHSVDYISGRSESSEFNRF